MKKKLRPLFSGVIEPIKLGSIEDVFVADRALAELEEKAALREKQMEKPVSMRTVRRLLNMVSS